MGYKLTVTDNPEYQIIKISGTLSKDITKKIVDEALEICVATRYCNMLIDVRQLELATSLIDDFFQATYAAAAFAGKKHRIAHLTREDKLEADQFFETVGLNRGLKIRTFIAEEDAINWLKKE